MKRQATVYLICGFIGAGKTTFAKMLEKKTGAVRIVKDEWSIRLIGNDPTIDGYEEWDRKIIDLSRDVAHFCFSGWLTILLTFTLPATCEEESNRRRVIRWNRRSDLRD